MKTDIHLFFRPRVQGDAFSIVRLACARFYGQKYEHFGDVRPNFAVDTCTWNARWFFESGLRRYYEWEAHQTKIPKLNDAQRGFLALQSAQISEKMVNEFHRCLRNMPFPGFDTSSKRKRWLRSAASLLITGYGRGENANAWRVTSSELLFCQVLHVKPQSSHKAMPLHPCACMSAIFFVNPTWLPLPVS